MAALGQRPQVDLYSRGEERHRFDVTVVRQINETMPKFKSLVPPDVDVRYEFSKSPTVKAAIRERGH